ncbi:hypothetical protein AB0L99_33350 [Streptomyces sp. NPDC051954]|uniref:hypothetical protein n=1 Tax=Streptomyces sp. NPDC051954 TaxID=3155524 RepID=UPI00342BD78E
MPLSRPARAAAVVALLAATTAACGDAGGLQGAGPTPTAVSPARLWPDLPPASSPAYEIGEVENEVIKGISVKGGDIRKVDPVAIVRAEIATSPGDYEGGKAQFHETGDRMADCAEGGDRAKCPVLRPYYRDLTGDGRVDLTLGFRQLPGTLTAVRVYTVTKGRLVRVMSWEDAMSAVELAGRSVIIRSPSEVAGYEYRLQWTWDANQHTMLLTHDEMLRTGIGTGTGKATARPSASASASASASGAASASPSASASASASPR